MSTVALPTSERFKAAIDGCLFREDHGLLLKALGDEMPGLDFTIGTTGEESYSENMIHSAEGTLIAEKVSLWIRAQVEDLGSPRAVTERYGPVGYIRTVGTMVPHFVTAAVGPGVLDVIQARINLACVRPHQTFCGPRTLDPYSTENLVFGDNEDPLDERDALTLRTYKFVDLVHWRTALEEMSEIERARREEVVRTKVIQRQEGQGPRTEHGFLELYPDYLDYEVPSRRFVRDWAATQAEGPRLHARWGLAVFDYTEGDERTCGAIPKPFDIDRAPQVSDDGSIWNLRARLEAFDKALGYDFAWYFHMLYGNRLEGSVGSRICKGIEAGQLRLPEPQEQVLLAWQERPYGF